MDFMASWLSLVIYPIYLNFKTLKETITNIYMKFNKKLNFRTYVALF